MIFSVTGSAWIHTHNRSGWVYRQTTRETFVAEAD